MLRTLGAILAVLVCLACASPSSTRAPDPVPTDKPRTAAPSALAFDPVSGLAVVRLSDLPPEATHTVDLITANGPFPYDQDGATFDNREGILPTRPSGYYHEYTVVTPGSNDRGARRIVAGSPGEMYWTADHYLSFARILDDRR